MISGTPTSAGTFTIAATLTDAAGATATKNLSITINPLPTISSVTLANGGATQGKLEKSDTITVVFSAQMSVSSFCSTWSGDTTNQTLSGSSDVTITVTDGTGATNDSLTVTSATCTFRFGSINLGSNAYVSGGNATFGGSGNNKSTIQWTADTRTLTHHARGETGRNPRDRELEHAGLHRVGIDHRQPRRRDLQLTVHAGGREAVLTPSPSGTARRE